MATSDRPRSRGSATLRRLLEMDDTAPDPTDVYGDSDLVTVVYPATGEDPHRGQLAACVAALARADDRLASDVVRGVCHVNGDAVPLVWLLPREWALAFVTEQLGAVDVPEPTITGATESSALTDLSIQETAIHG